MEDNKEKKNKLKINDPLIFIIGLLLLGAGLFMLSRKVIVHSGWHGWNIGGWNISSGTVVIPLIIGIVWYFFNPKSIVPKIIMILSGIFLIVTIIMSVNLNFVSTSLFDYVLMIGMAAAGGGLVLRSLFAKKE